MREGAKGLWQKVCARPKIFSPNIRYFVTIFRFDDAFFAKIANTRLTKIFVAIFALVERLPTSATLTHGNAELDKLAWEELVLEVLTDKSQHEPE